MFNIFIMIYTVYIYKFIFIYKIVIFILLLVLGVLLFQNYLLRHNVKEAVEQGGTLPPGVQQEVTVKQDHVTIKEKKVNTVTGETKVDTQTLYVPPEGSCYYND